jgi:hypothetical protein
MAQVVALGSNSSTTEKQQKNLMVLMNPKWQVQAGF